MLLRNIDARNLPHIINFLHFPALQFHGSVWPGQLRVYFVMTIEPKIALFRYNQIRYKRVFTVLKRTLFVLAQPRGLCSDLSLTAKAP